MIAWIKKWLQGRAKSKSDLKVEMMTRQGCHLCEETWALLLLEQKRYGFQLSRTDIDEDPALVLEHGDKVPVVLVNGRARCWGRINPVLLRRSLRGGS